MTQTKEQRIDGVNFCSLLYVSSFKRYNLTFSYSALYISFHCGLLRAPFVVCLYISSHELCISTCLGHKPRNLIRYIYMLLWRHLVYMRFTSGKKQITASTLSQRRWGLSPDCLRAWIAVLTLPGSLLFCFIHILWTCQLP